MSYETFDRKNSRRRMHFPAVSILKQGRLGLNGFATELFIKRGVTHVLLLLDRHRGRIAIQPCKDSTDPRAYQIAFDITNKNRGGGVNGSAFLKHAKISSKSSQQYPAEWNEGENILEVQLPETAFDD